VGSIELTLAMRVSFFAFVLLLAGVGISSDLARPPGRRLVSGGAPGPSYLSSLSSCFQPYGIVQAGDQRNNKSLSSPPAQFP
jgi:hypothetical protein